MYNQLKIIDLRSNAIIPDEIQDDFKECAYSARIIFNDLISQYIEFEGSSNFLSFHEPFSRNTYSSNTFYYLTTLIYLDRLLSNKNNRKYSYRIIVDSPAQKKLLNQINNNKSFKAIISYDNAFSSYYTLVKKSILSPLKCILFRFFQLLITNLSGQLSCYKGLEFKNIILIDTFLTPRNTNEKKWYGTFLDYLDKEQKESIYFVPTLTLFSLKDFFIKIPKIRKSNHQKIIKDDFISIGEYFKSIKLILKSKSYKLPSIKYKYLNISPLFQEGLSSPNDFLSLIEAYLNLIFFSKLRKQAVNVKLTIDWFEGHAIDKSWNLAVKYNFPNAKRIGNRSMISLPFCLCTIPTRVERKKYLTPDIILLPGSAIKSIVREFDQKIQCYIAPSFRFEYLNTYLYNRSKFSNKNTTFNILVTLPISKYSSIAIINLLFDIQSSLVSSSKNIFINVRKHPGSSIDLKKHIKETNGMIKISKNSHILDCYNHNDILLTHSSVTAIEAIVLGLPTFIIATNLPGLIDDPIPNEIPSELFFRVKTKSQLISEINKLISISNTKYKELYEKARLLKSNYFSNVTKDKALKMLEYLDI